MKIFKMVDVQGGECLLSVCTIEMNITGTLPPTGNLKPNLKASPSLFTHAKSAQSVNHYMNVRVLTPRHACLGVKIWLQEKDRQFI
jgi:hypothetical protein